MNKRIKILIFIIILFSMVQLAFANDVCRIYSSDNWVEINKTFDCTVQVVANKKIGKAIIKLNYDKSYLQFVESKSAIEKDGIVLIDKKVDGNREIFNIKFKAIKKGETKVEILSRNIYDTNNILFKDVKYGYSIINIRDNESFNSQIDYKNNIRKCFERSIEYEEKYHLMYNSIIEEVTKDNILYADYLCKKNKELPYLNGLLENYYNTIENADINYHICDLMDLGVDSGILDIVYSDFDNDNQKELLLITLNKLLLEDDRYCDFNYQIGFQIVDIINNEIVESNVIYNKATFDFHSFDIKIGIRVYNDNKIIYCQSSGKKEFHVDGFRNFIENYHYNSNKLYIDGLFEDEEHGDGYWIEEEQDEYERKKMRYINDNNFIGINSKEKFKDALGAIFPKDYNDLGECIKDISDEVKGIFDSDDFQYVYSIYRYPERIHMDYEQRFYRLR